MRKFKWCSLNRETFVFVGCHDGNDLDKAAVKLFKLKEKQRDITQYASYGAIEIDEVDFAIDAVIPTNFIGDILYVQTILRLPLLVPN